MRLELALVKDQPVSIVVTKVGSDRQAVLPKREIAWTRMAKRFVEGRGGIKQQLVEVEIPEWLARNRGLT